ncbi:4Fe-4S binding protein [Evansella sp. AB-P1]|uniref:4Fe-4S binding protein n=1 Tax=Evansella sp. AB-P1 TaxID=3037653 RepID=UPI002420184F|nr:4Fe-4S binding protein [Evansella sp. AB-P1]MDG5786093.1 4Fe-4S binding protein [Evansella sp. AB-P1]
MWHSFLIKRVIEKNSVQFMENRCLRLRNKHSTCERCLDACGAPAISLLEGEISFDDTTCTNCRICVHECPTNAFYHEYEMMNHYEQKIIYKEVVCFTCEEQGNYDKDVTLPCIASLTPEMIMNGILHEKKIQVFWDERKCHSCKHYWFQKGKLEWLHAWNEKAIPKERVEIIHERKEKAGSKRKVTRREMFSFSKQKATNSVASIALDTVENIPSIRNKIPISEKRNVLVAYKKKKELSMEMLKTVAKEIHLGNVNVTDNCNLCGVCCTVCPTGALNQYEDEKKKTMTFQGYLCVDCNSCTTSCMQIRKSSFICDDFDQEKIVREEQLDTCPQCTSLKIKSECYCEDCQIKFSKKDLLKNW